METGTPTAAPKHKLRWYQYSLRTLLIVVTLFAFACSWLAVKIKQASRQKEAVDALLKLGGSVQYDYEVDPKGFPISHYYEVDSKGFPISDAKQPGPAWMRKVLGDDFFRTVSEIDLYNSKITDADLVHLKTLDQIYGLTLLETPITDSGLVHLKGLSRLKRLSLWVTQISDAGLKQLEGLPLEALILSETKVTDAGLQNLKGLKELQELYLEKTKVTDKGVADLQKVLPKCRIIR
jgi:hypothetical protein